MSAKKTALKSMTGFARVDGSQEDHQWTWEVRSVNGRGLELRFRLPYGFDDLELSLRKTIAKKLSRGSVNVNLGLRREAGGVRLQLNHQALKDVLAMVSEVENTQSGLEPSSATNILALKGVVETRDVEFEDAERSSLLSSLEKTFDDVLSQLVSARAAEGAALAAAITEQLEQVRMLATNARAQASGSSDKLRDRITAQLDDLAADINVNEDRLAQEVAVLAVKADIREELDRLDAHLEAAFALLAQQEPIGRKFDFLIQEFNREVNTLCSKAPDIDLKKTGLELKTVIDQMREQIQNVE